MPSAIAALGAQLRRRALSCTELTQHYLDTISRENGTLGAYVTVTEETALAAAAAFDRRLAAGEALPPLAGIPFSLKDNISTRGIETTCCSNLLRGYRPVYDASVWELLQAQGAVLLGKTNMDEFGMGSSGEHSCFGAAKNPLDPTRVAGGSSSGAAAAVAGGLCAFALGSDTGGSVRLPAAFCGIVGFKPTYGVLSRYGLIAYASSLDQIGILTETAEDAALVLPAIASHDPRDSTSRPMPPFDPAALQQDLRGVRIAMPTECFEGLPAPLAAALEEAAACLRGCGAAVTYCSMPILRRALPAYYILASAEAASNLGRYDGIRYGMRAEAGGTVDEQIARTRSAGFGAEVQRRILLGTHVLREEQREAYYRAAQTLRGALIAETERLFSAYDLLLTPTVPTTAFPLGFAAQDPLAAWRTDLCTVFANLAGLPALSLPCGCGPDGMPYGMQLVGARFGEPMLLRAAIRYENSAAIPRPRAKKGVQL